MKRLISCALCFLCAALLSRCSPGEGTGALTQSDSAVIAAEVRHILAMYFDDIKARGLTAEFSYLDSSEAFFWVPPGVNEPLAFDSVKTILIMNAGQYKQIQNEWLALKVIPISSTTALYTGKIRSISMDTTGQTDTVYLLETGCVKKLGTSWKLAGGQTQAMRQN